MLNDEKTRGWKSLDTVPLKILKNI
jgi:hypothetical protein